MRGFDLFESLDSKVKNTHPYKSIKDKDDQIYKVEQLIVNDNPGQDYKEYEMFYILNDIGKSQTFEETNKLLIFRRLLQARQEGRLGKQYKFGSKIGQKISNSMLKWVEKWGNFIMNDEIEFKYVCKFWYTNQHSIQFEHIYQEFSKSYLSFELIEKGQIELVQQDQHIINDIMKITKNFYDNNVINEIGFRQVYDYENDKIELENWKTDHTTNIYEKEKYARFISKQQQNLTGEREGRNQYGQVWQEKWYKSWDGKYQGYSKMTTEENDQVKLQWGELQDQNPRCYLKTQKWQEKLQKHDNYWENSWESITNYLNNSNQPIVKQGQKMFKNNKQYVYNEDWRELNNGEINVKKFLDNGYGMKSTEYYTLIKRGDQAQHEYSTGIIEDIGQNQKIEVQKGKNYINQNDEWENKKIYDFNQNYEKISNVGKNNLGFWKEEWGEQNNQKWAYKEGQNFFTQEQWKEEWYEKRTDDNQLEESKSEKWGKNAQEEWLEKWGEINKGNIKEKWADKFAIDLQSGYRRGENWGHIYDGNNQPQHHWIEHWDNQGKLQKRQEYF